MEQLGTRLKRRGEHSEKQRKHSAAGLRSIQISGEEDKKDGGQGDPCGAQRLVYRPAQWHPAGQEAVPQDQGSTRRHTLPAPGVELQCGWAGHRGRGRPGRRLPALKAWERAGYLTRSQAQEERGRFSGKSTPSGSKNRCRKTPRKIKKKKPSKKEKSFRLTVNRLPKSETREKSTTRFETPSYLL